MGTLDHVGVSHLFLVPNIRSSKYLSLLAEACPEIANSPKGEIQAEVLPHLKVGADAKAYFRSRLTFHLIAHCSGRQYLRLARVPSRVGWLQTRR